MSLFADFCGITPKIYEINSSQIIHLIPGFLEELLERILDELLEEVSWGTIWEISVENIAEIPEEFLYRRSWRNP